MTAREDLARAWAAGDPQAFAVAYNARLAELGLPPSEFHAIEASIGDGTHYTDDDGTRHRKHDVFGGPHDEPPEEITLSTPVKYTYASLRAYLDEHGIPGDSAHHEGLTAELPDAGVTVHDHPHGGAGRELHVMVNGLKTAEIGPPDDSDLRPGEADDNVPGYIDFLEVWTGRDVTDERHARIKTKIALDNGVRPYPDTREARSRALVAWGKGDPPRTPQNTTVYEGFTAGWQAAVEFMTR